MELPLLQDVTNRMVAVGCLYLLVVAAALVVFSAADVVVAAAPAPPPTEAVIAMATALRPVQTSRSRDAALAPPFGFLPQLSTKRGLR